MAGVRVNDRYRVLRRLGAGGEGTVWLVADGHADGAERALKLVESADGAARDRLAAEFARLARLDHPHLVRAYDLEYVTTGPVDIPPGAMFFTADHAPGLDPVRAIAEAAEDQRLSLVLDLVDQVASALAHVHAAGLVHCDVKPSNITVRVDASGLRATLLDLGISAARGVAGQARGTPAYMSPEAMAGMVDPRSDLYGLGATLHEVITGSRAFPQAGAALVRAISDGLAAPCASAWAPASVVDLCGRLLSPSVADRPSTALVVLDDIARIRDAHGIARQDLARPAAAAVLPPRLVGREPVVARLREAIREVPTVGATRVVRVVGPPGVGKRTVVEAALRRTQLDVAAERAVATPQLRGTVDMVAAVLRDGYPTDSAGPPADEDHGSTPDTRARLARWVDLQLERIAAHATPRGLVLVLDSSDDERRDAVLDAIEAAPPVLEGVSLLVVACIDGEPAAETRSSGRRMSLPVAPLAPEDVALLASSMLGRVVDSAWARDLAVACGGLPRLVTEAVRAAASEGGVQNADQVPVARLTTAEAALAQLLVRRVAALPPNLCSVLEAIAVHGGRATVAALCDTLDEPLATMHLACAELATHQLVVFAGETLMLPSQAHADALHEAIPSARRKALHRAALRYCEARSHPSAIEVAQHLVETGPAKRAVDAVMVASAALSDGGRPAAALALLERIATTVSGTAAADVGLRMAELSIDTGAYEAAIDAAGRATRSRDRSRRLRARLAMARARQMHGDYASADAELAKLVASDDVGDEARGAYARLLVARGKYEQAIEVAGDAVADAPPEGALSRGHNLRLEALCLALLYQERLDEAAAAVSRLEVSARASSSGSQLGKALGLRGMIAQSTGALDDAGRLYGRAHEAAAEAGDLHAAAVYAINRGSVCSGRGRYGEALVALDAATVALRRIGRVAELAGAVFNRGIVLLRLGELEAARRTAEDAQALARDYGTPQWQVYANLLDGDVARRAGERGHARICYDQALAHARTLGSARPLAHALINAAELSAEDGDHEAVALCEEARSHAAAEEDVDACLLARARVALSLGHDGDGLGAELASAASRMNTTGSHDTAWRCLVVGARLAHAQGQSQRAKELMAGARTTFDEILTATQEARRAGVETDPDAVSLRWLEHQLPDETSPAAPATPTLGRDRDVRRLLALSRRLNSELRLGPLLDQVMDLVIDLTCAERGFLLLRNDDTNALDVVVARNFEQGEVAGDELQVSRSIAEQAAQSGDAVLTVDAGIDERFGGAASVAALNLRSVLAVPLRQKGRITGTIYVDHRFRRGVFDDDAIVFVRELADIAAVAIENARLVDENRRRAEKIADLNRRLETEVVEKEAELANVRARLTSERRGGLRHAYDAIVGRSPAVLDMLRTLDRATDTDLPVVILGESGTGKELVARALHQNGARRGEAFVAINCGAVPESLLESELFGHARGSFTGASRDRRGLFEVASGGTLLLDEVADTSLAMQAKLLRVLQEREIRRVGETATRAVDVRVIAASNRDLRDLVEAGAFREDLYYRLEVLRVVVPPLRERVEDIQALVEHILSRVGDDDGPPQVTAAAFARLCAHSWPGNVRELENELVRAAALSGGTIDVGDLSPRIAAATGATTAATPGPLLLKPRVEALERALVEEALTRTHGNQTRAAKLLGLSRYGLQKKLKRYGISGSV